MNIKRLLSIFVAFTILTQNAIFAYNINFENANNYSSEIEQISHYSLTEEKEPLSDVIDNDVSFMSLENDHIETNHRKQINTIVDKYVMSPPGENEVRVIATYNTENNNVLAAGLSDNNNISEGRNLSAYQAVMNVSENDLEELLENDSISLVENDHLVYMSSLDTSLDVSLDASLDTELETSETDISVMIGNYYPDSFDPIDIESYHEDDIFGSNVKIAIMDTGLNPKSTELNLYGGATFVDESNSFADDNGHGTAMAGIIGAAMDNQGLTGIAPMAELYSVKVLNSDGIGYVSSVIEGIHWAVENDMDIICFGFTSKEYSSALETAVEYAYENGIIMIAPAGNYGSDDVCYPAGYDEVVSVGSTDYSGNVSEFSNYGSYVDVYAPGEDIDSILYINNKPTPFTGTSAAAAHVAGVAALIINQSNNSALTPNTSVFSINKLENSGFSVNNEVLLERVDTSPNKQLVLSTADSLTAKSYSDTEEISARNTVIASTSIGINTLVKGTIDSSKQKRYYHFNLTSAYQDVVFVLNSPEGYDYRIFLEDYYSNTAIDVTNNTLSLAAGRYSFYVCGKQDDDYNSELEYSLILLLTAIKSYTVERRFSDGVNETTGNFGYTFDDLTTTIGGKEFKIQRYYNSSDLTDTHFNAGWRFNFECYAYHPNSYEYDPEEEEETLKDPDENVIAVIIPDGSILKFQRRSKNEKNTEWDYVPLDSRAEIDCSRFDWSLDLVVTMPDKTKYYYYPMKDPEIEGLEYDSLGCLYKIVDKYGNETQINLDQGKITDIVDYAGNNYNFEYNEQGKLVSISDDFGREVTYEYDGDKLIKSTDSAGNSYSYSYSSLGRMSELMNSAGGRIYKITYETDLYIPDLLVVKDLTDENGTTYRYGYDTNNNTTTVTEITEDETTSGKITSSTYDRERQITYRKNEKNETVLMEYYYQQSGSFGINSNDEITFIVDKNYHIWPNGQLISYTNEAGVVTKNEFDIFERFCGAGLPISTTVSDASGTVYEYVSYEYDRNDNLVLVKNWLEKPETGTGKYKATRYIYDEDGIYLLKKAEYLPILSSNQSVPELTSNNADDFAITSYEYDENHSIKGLVKKIVYPQQYTGAETDKGWKYEYDSNGNCISVTNPESTSDNQIKETYEYNDFGKVSKYTSGEGNVVRYEYNNNGQETKRIYEISDTETAVYRTIYNTLGLPVQVISPNQYNETFEQTGGSYSDTDSGVRYEYNIIGQCIKETDADGNAIQYTYDKYGNVATQTLPNGSKYYYLYDLLDNLTDVLFKPSGGRLYQVEMHTTSRGNGTVTKADYAYNDYNECVSGTYNQYNHFGKLYRSYDTMIYDTNPLMMTCGYDLSGNLIWQESRLSPEEQTLTVYFPVLYDETGNNRYAEKYTSREGYFASYADMTNMYDELSYRYEKTVYDKNGNVIQTLTTPNVKEIGDGLTDSEIISETSEYYADNLLKSVTDVYGVKTEYEYDNDRILSKITVTVPGKEPTVIAYENNWTGKPETVKTYLAPERITDSSNLIHDTSGYYTLTTNTYDKNGNLLKQVPNVGAATEYTYNNRNMQTSVTAYTSGENSQSMSESYTYDFLGNVTSQTDRNGNVTKYLYDQRGNLAYTIYPNNKTAFTVYDNTGRLITQVEPGDYTGDVTLQNADITEYETDLAAVDTMNRTEYTYDQKNNVLTAVRYTYNEETQTFDSTVKVTNTYDNAGRLVETTDGLGNTYKYEYDVQGNCIKYTDPTKADTESYTTSYEYDMLGRNTKESNSYGDSYTYTYDKKGNLTGVSVTYNGETDTISTYTYDPAGKLLTQTDGNNHTTTLTYDDNNLLETQYAHGGANDPAKTDSFKFDSRGNLAEHTDRNGNTTEYTYDGFGRLIETENGEESITYTYDNIGNVLTMTDSSGTTTYTYDSMGRILTKNHSATGTVTYTYDDYTDVPYGLVSETTTDPKGNTVEKWYDSLDKIYKVIDGNDVTVYNYYENDKLSSVTVPGGTTTSYTYDEEGNLLTLTNKNSDGTVLDSFTYTYSDDTLGVKNQVSKTETVGGVLKGTTSYEYDGLGRLTKTVTPDGVQNVYTYDGAGNRLTKTSTAGEESAVTEYTYDEQNRLLNTSAYVAGGTDEVNTYYGYDNNGNQISRWTQTEKTSGTEDAVTLSELGINAADETAVYEYDVFNRLTAIYQGDTIIENTYDGAGDNISRVEDGVPVYYVYDGNTVILELDGNGAEKARNVYGRNLIAREVDGVTAIYRYNGHGDVITIMGTDGTAISSYEYDEFGNETASTGTFDNPYRYAGYEYLDEVELYDLNARYYDPSIARFLTEDPYYNLGNRVMGVYEINVPNVYSIMQANALYAYCGNSPIIFIDPSGLDYYVFYGEDQEWAAEQYEKQLKKDYSDVPVHMVFVDTPDTFYTEWNNMGIVDGETVSIDGVIVNLHGNPTNIYASDGNEIDIGELTNDSKIETMLLLSCNAGHMDYENNMAVQFLKAANIRNVIAPDGTHYRDEFKGIFGLWANVKSIVKADETFKKYAIDKDRSSTGFVSFSLNSLGQVAYNFNVLDSINENEIRAVDLFKHKHFFASPYEEGLR